LDRITTLIDSETDAETAFRNLVALGTIMTMGGEVNEAATNIYNAKSVAQGAATRIKDPRISQIAEDIGRVISSS
jgi:hypothetical protein